MASAVSADRVRVHVFRLPRASSSASAGSLAPVFSSGLLRAGFFERGFARTGLLRLYPSLHSKHNLTQSNTSLHSNTSLYSNTSSAVAGFTASFHLGVWSALQHAHSLCTALDVHQPRAPCHVLRARQHLRRRDGPRADGRRRDRCRPRLCRRPPRRQPAESRQRRTASKQHRAAAAGRSWSWAPGAVASTPCGRKTCRTCRMCTCGSARARCDSSA